MINYETELLSRRKFLHFGLGVGLTVLNPYLSILEEEPYYTQSRQIETDGGVILIQAGSLVRPRALEIAEQEVLYLTDYRTELRTKLAEYRFLVPIIPNRTSIRTLPEFSNYAGETRGWGGIRGGRAIAAIAEENLLGLPDDQFTRAGILIAPHEIGHAIRRTCLTASERLEWLGIFARISSEPGFPKTWERIGYGVETFLRQNGEEEMFADCTRIGRQGQGSRIRNKDSEIADYFLRIYGAFF